VHRYREALRSILRTETKAYGFALVIWGTGALSEAQRGTPSKVSVVAFIGGAIAAMGIITAVTLGGPFARWKPQQRAVTRYPIGSVHIVSVSAAIAAGWAVTIVLTDQALAYLASSATAIFIYQLALGAEIALARVDGDDNTRG
jgi:hypothetical protein